MPVSPTTAQAPQPQKPEPEIRKARRRHRHYTDAEIELALTGLALVDGNARRAATELGDLGLDVPYRTLYQWTRDHAKTYARIRVELVPYRKRARSHLYTQLADRFIGGTDKPPTEATD